MLGRYVGVTLVALGGAMLLAPDADEAKGNEATAQVARAQGQPATVDADAARSAPRAVEERRAAPTERIVQARLAPDAPERPTDITGAAAGQERAAPVPTLEEPDTIADASVAPTARTQALIEAAERAADGAPISDAALAGRETVRVTGTRVNVRAGPSTQYAVIDSVVYGDELELLSDDTGNWARVRLPSGRPGFIAFGLLSRAPAGG